ncbi:MAG: hypothetical protein IJT94_17460 [Oscillibacter sp.]|nr:hypothetical protein [Oscillibacter sp.]
MSEIELRVTPEALRQKAGEFTDLVRAMRSHAARISSLSGRTRNYWQGRAGDQDRAGFRMYLEELSPELDRLDGQIQRLLNMAGVYRSAEADAAGTMASLKTDIIGEDWLL